ncbi:MAG TPA: DUF6351 family protein [Vicinamibacterales bacterium]|jgi:hypothetical protein
MRLSSLTALVIVLALPWTGAAQSLQVRVVSNPKPEFVSGGDVLISMTPPSGVQASAVRLTLNGADVTSALRADATGRSILALVKNLNDGSNAIVATAGKSTTRLTVVNHPNAGPVISGPHEQPFICETEKFKLMAGGVAGKPLDANCSIATRIDYVYKSTAGGDLKPLPDPKSTPSDVAMTTTTLGVQAPFIVRVETGTINRGVYEIAMLFNPGKDAQPDVMTRPAGWNGRLIYTFGGGCAGGWYKQGTGTGGVDDEAMLQQGYAVASNSLNVFGNDCSELLAIETMMMTKEHFVEAYGAPTFTVGWGGSGATYQQHQIGDGYPGLLDGLMVQRSFPDMEFGTVGMISDARLLANYFDKLAGTVTFTDEQQRRIAGLGQLATLKTNGLNPGRITVGEYCSLPEALRYDAVKNPTGARCDVYDHGVNVWGRDPKTGFARRPLDNVGIQYGMGALNAGVITKEQFLDLNAKIGGYDNDGKIVATRSVADPAAIRTAYRMGRLTWGGAGLATTPIIDYRAYLDDAQGGNIHLRYHSFSTRERLQKANGYTDNQVMLTDDRRWGDSLKAPVLRQALSQMDQWLTKIADDTSGDSKLAKLRRAKPADLVDACWTRDDRPQRIVERQMPASGKCNELYPANSFPRGVAGSPLAADVIKCQLKPVSAADYKVTFTADEMSRLKQIFPGGVCDWSKPGVDQQPMTGTWQALPASTTGNATR